MRGSGDEVSRATGTRLSFVVFVNPNGGRLAHLADDEVVGEAEAEQVFVETLRLLPCCRSPAQAHALLDGACDEFFFGRLLIDEFERGVGGLLRDLPGLEVAREALTTDG